MKKLFRIPADKKKTGILQKSEGGFIFVLSCLLMATMVLIALAFLARGHVFFQATERNHNKTIAFNLAESGLDQTLSQLSRPDFSHADHFSRYPCAAGTAYAAGGCTTGFVPFALEGNAQGGYKILVRDPNPVSTFRQVDVAGHWPVSGDAGGVAGNLSADCPAVPPAGVRGYECRSLTAYVELDNTLFEYAVFSEANLTLNGSAQLIDSFNANNGNYGGANVFNRGDLGSNAKLNTGNNDPSVPWITLNGNPTVNGTIYEELGIECKALDVTPPIGSMGQLKKNGDYTLPTVPGNIYRYDNVKIGGQANLIINPPDNQPVTIYVDGNFEFLGNTITSTVPVTLYIRGELKLSGNGVVTASNNPRNFIVIATGNANIDISGGSAFYGAVFAPDSAVNISGNVSTYGAIFAAQFDHNGGPAMHYDESLKDFPLPCTVARLRSWREKNTTAGS